MADKSPIPESRLEGVFSRKKVDHDSQTRESNTHDSGVMIHDSGSVKPEARTIDPNILKWAITKGCEDPRISGYSVFAMSVLRYLRKTTPEFSMSGAASSLLEEALREKYPELSKRVTEEIEKNGQA